MPEGFNIAELLMQYFCLLFSLCIHEAAHGFVADKCGDPTARLLGRVTLNPLAHIDVIGTIVMPLLMFTTSVPFLIGWAKPVPVNPLNLKNMRRDNVLVSLAGPASNLTLALICAAGLRAVIMLANAIPMPEAFINIVDYLLLINLLLAVFNMIPVPPLDGSQLLIYALPEGAGRAVQSLGMFGIIIAIFAARFILWPPVAWLYERLLDLALWGLV